MTALRAPPADLMLCGEQDKVNGQLDVYALLLQDGYSGGSVPTPKREFSFADLEPLESTQGMKERHFLFVRRPGGAAPEAPLWLGQVMPVVDRGLGDRLGSLQVG